MPLYIKDDATAALVAELAQARGVSKQDAVKMAVQAALDRLPQTVPLRERFAALRAAHRCRRRQASWRTRLFLTSFPAVCDGIR